MRFSYLQCSFKILPARALTRTILAVSVAASAGCGSESQTVVDHVPEAENLFFTDNGRLFVSGGNHVFEIIQTADGRYEKLDTFGGECLIEGITEYHDVLYAVCSKTNAAEFADSYLLATPISGQTPTETDINEPGKHPFMALSVIHALDTLGIPNGLVTDEFGQLFVTDSVRNNIVKITMASAFEVASVDVWVAKQIPLVNGIEWVGDALYVTGMNLTTLSSTFVRIQRNPDGSAGEQATLLSRFGTLLDDIAYAKGGFLITDYLKGSVLFWREGKIVGETPADTFFSPTAVIQGQSPMFSPDNILVTEKGIIFNSDPALGNKLGLYEPTFW